MKLCPYHWSFSRSWFFDWHTCWGLKCGIFCRKSPAFPLICKYWIIRFHFSKGRLFWDEITTIFVILNKNLHLVQYFVSNLVWANAYEQQMFHHPLSLNFWYSKLYCPCMWRFSSPIMANKMGFSWQNWGPFVSGDTGRFTGGTLTELMGLQFLGDTSSSCNSSLSSILWTSCLNKFGASASSCLCRILFISVFSGLTFQEKRDFWRSDLTFLLHNFKGCGGYLWKCQP